MKKYVCLLITILSLICLVGCSYPEHPIKLEFYDENDNLAFEDKVSLHSNTLAPEIGHVYLEHKFMGWTYTHGKTTSDFKARDIIYYHKLKDKAENGIVKCYAVYKKLTYKVDGVDTPFELCVGFDGRTNISGLTPEIMDAFKVALNKYIKEDCGYPDVNIRYKDYSKDYYGNQLDDTKVIGNLINVENIADILIGFGLNLDISNQGNVTVVHKTQDVLMAGKLRYIHRRNNFVLTKLAYEFVTSIEGQRVLNPEAQSNRLVIGWDARNSYSGLTETKVNNYIIALKEYLASLGFKDYELIVRPYTAEDAKELGKKINGDGDCDILLGFGVNINLSSGSSVSVVHMKEVQMDAKKRYVCQITSSILADKVYNWTITEGNKSIGD